jgi:hypothetical protein
MGEVKGLGGVRLAPIITRFYFSPYFLNRLRGEKEPNV